MFSINQQEGTLMCNRVGHNYSPILGVCMKKGCQEPIPCCFNCMTKEHRNHQQQDFVQMSAVQGQDTPLLKYLSQLAQLAQSISEVCQSWKKEILKLIDHLRQKEQLSQNPTLTELSNYVRRVREKDAQQRQTEPLQKLKNELQQIEERLIALQKEAKGLLKWQDEQDNKLNQQSVVKQEILNVNQLKFTSTYQFKLPLNKIEFVSISNDDTFLALSQFENNTVILWDIKSNKILTQYKSYFKRITTQQFSKDNRMLGVCGLQLLGNRIIEIFDLTDLSNTQAKIKLEGHKDIITSITFTYDSNYLISVSRDYSLRIWDLKQKKQINEQKCEDWIYGLSYSYEKQLIVCSDRKGLVYLFDCRTLNNLKLQVKWQAHGKSTRSVEFLRNSTVLMTGGEEEIRFWEVENLLNQKFQYFKEIQDAGYAVKVYPVDNPQVNIINHSSDGQFVKLWNYDLTELIQQIQIPGGFNVYSWVLNLEAFALTSDFKKIIIGGNSQMVNIFEQK